MLKYWLALLLLLNAAVLAWQWDAFAPWGHGPNVDREPQRLKQQVRPEALKLEVMPPASPEAPSAPTDTNGQASAISAADASGPDVAPQPPPLPGPPTAAPRSTPP
jgi:hypothetical protein